MKISDYMPKIYSQNKEMRNIINTEELELENRLKPYIESSFNDTFIKTASLNGIEKYEKILNIPSNVEDETIDFRKKRLQSRFIGTIPFTQRFLDNMLNQIIGKDNWHYTMHYNNFVLDIYSLAPGNNWYRELVQLLERVMPCNIDWRIHIYAASWAQVFETFDYWESIYDNNMTWEELMNGEWLN